MKMIAVGETVPACSLIELPAVEEGCPKAAVTVDVLQAVKDKTIVIFFVPGAYTPTCSERHAPEFIHVRSPVPFTRAIPPQHFRRSSTRSPLRACTRLGIPMGPRPGE